MVAVYDNHIWHFFQNLATLPDGKIDFSKLFKQEEEIDVDKYFSKKELEEMSSYDKKRYKNLKMNYEVMLMMGRQFNPSLKLHFYIVKLGFTGVFIILLISAQNIDCGYSLEPPR